MIFIQEELLFKHLKQLLFTLAIVKFPSNKCQGTIKRVFMIGSTKADNLRKTL